VKLPMAAIKTRDQWPILTRSHQEKGRVTLDNNGNQRP
jgi:hypothetical protein